MNCETCLQVNPINRCSASITIDEVSGTPDANYTVIITNTATGRKENIAADAVDNELTFDLDFELMTEQTYKIEVFEEGDYNQPRTITIGGESSCCVEFTAVDFDIETEDGTDSTLSINTCE